MEVAGMDDRRKTAGAARTLHGRRDQAAESGCAARAFALRRHERNAGKRSESTSRPHSTLAMVEEKRIEGSPCESRKARTRYFSKMGPRITPMRIAATW